MAKLASQPFDVRFEDIVRRLDRHLNDVCVEIQIKDRERENKERIKQEEERIKSDSHRTDTTIERIDSWLDSPRYYETYESALDARLRGTATWLFDMPRFVRWASGVDKDASERLLWVSGSVLKP